MSSYLKYASILLENSIDKTLDYGVLPEQEEKVQRGMRVEVPLRGRLVSGYIINLKESADIASVKPISRLLSDMALINDEIFDLALWMAKYYASPLRQVFKTILPISVRNDSKPKEQLFVMRAKTRDELASLALSLRNKSRAQAQVIDLMLQVNKGILLTELLELTSGSKSPIETLAKKGFLKLDQRRIDRSPLVDEEYFKTSHKILVGEQLAALNSISNSIASKSYAAHLLYGITGSGKTEVYLQAIEKTLALGKNVIMLVPEISLTPQTIHRFRSRFEGQIAVLHHRLSNGERFDEWHRIYRGDARITIGARSAVFSPVPHLGLIIVDEEHEPSYKQSDHSPCYHARDVAVKRAHLSQAVVLLGSATPSLESYHNALQGKYILNKLTTRASHAKEPTVTIVDMKRELEKGNSTFSDLLLAKIKERLVKGEHTLLFLNRRGYHTVMLCRGCGKPISCIHCSSSLTFHREKNSLTCHLCGYLIPPPKICPLCHSLDTMKFRGVGTELIERAIHALFPDIRTLRIDADTTKHKGSGEKLLRDFGSGKADILIGTQMIAKGLHFPQVTLVAILNADASLNIPDFRAAETTFQLLTQVAGRSGRGLTPGEVIIQTSMPENATIRLGALQNYPAFYEREIESRRLFNFPPFSQLAKLIFSGDDEKETRLVAEEMRLALLPKFSKEYTLHPVVAAGHAKVKDIYRYQFLIRGPSASVISRTLFAVQQGASYADVSLRIDINPTSTFF